MKWLLEWLRNLCNPAPPHSAVALGRAKGSTADDMAVSQSTFLVCRWSIVEFACANRGAQGGCAALHDIAKPEILTASLQGPESPAQRTIQASRCRGCLSCGERAADGSL
jgi:hypothetical protein